MNYAIAVQGIFPSENLSAVGPIMGSVDNDHLGNAMNEFFEAWNARMWRNASGLLIWKSQKLQQARKDTQAKGVLHAHDRKGSPHGQEDEAETDQVPEQRGRHHQAERDAGRPGDQGG